MFQMRTLIQQRPLSCFWFLSQQTWQEEQFWNPLGDEKRGAWGLGTDKGHSCLQLSLMARDDQLIRKDPVPIASSLWCWGRRIQNVTDTLFFHLGSSQVRWGGLFGPIHSHRHPLDKLQKLHRVQKSCLEPKHPLILTTSTYTCPYLSLLSCDYFFYLFWKGGKEPRSYVLGFPSGNKVQS